MEDAHSTVLNMEKHPDCAFFGVFDGHSGNQAALWCAKHLAVGIDTLEQFTPDAVKVWIGFKFPLGSTFLNGSPIPYLVIDVHA